MKDSNSTSNEVIGRRQVTPASTIFFFLQWKASGLFSDAVYEDAGHQEDDAALTNKKQQLEEENKSLRIKIDLLVNMLAEINAEEGLQQKGKWQKMTISFHSYVKHQ